MKYKLGVMFGGESVEHEISIITANQAIAALDREKYEVVPLYIGKDRELYYGEKLFDLKAFSDLEKLKADCVRVGLVKDGDKVKVIPAKSRIFGKQLAEIDIMLPIVHGNNCEDGTLQGYIEMLRIPYVGSGVQAAAVGQDKIFMKQIFAQSGLPLVPWLWFYSEQYDQNQKKIVSEARKRLKFPVIVKPANLGSSVGIKVAKNEQELAGAIEFARGYDEKIIIEKLVEDLIEVNCSVLGNHHRQEASVLEEVAKNDEFLSYQDKYEGGGKTKGMVNTARIVPARLDQPTTQALQALAVEAFMALDASGVVRVDFLGNKATGEFFLNELNTIPGSLAYYLWKASGVEFGELLDRLIAIALENYRYKENLTYSYSTNVLANFKGAKGAKKL